MKSIFKTFALCILITFTGENASAKPKLCHSCMPSYMDVLECNEYPCYPTQTPNGGCKKVDCNKKSSISEESTSQNQRQKKKVNPKQVKTL